MIALYVTYRGFGDVTWQPKMKLIYRWHTILHKEMYEFVTDVLPFVVSVAYLLIILGGFILFRTDNFVFRMLLLVITVTFSGAIGILFKLGYGITLDSTNFLQSFTRSTALKKRVDEYFFKSCQPLSADIGRFCRLSRNTFPSVMHGIIINALITLLLTIPNTKE